VDPVTVVQAPETAPASEQTVARHVLWFFGGERGQHPGSFIGTLLTAISQADEENTELLRKVYPGYVAAVNLAKNAEHGMDILSAQAVSK
jgi:hypothetical protein